MKLKISVTLDKAVINEVSGLIGKENVSNLSMAIEYAIKEGLKVIRTAKTVQKELEEIRQFIKEGKLKKWKEKYQ